MRNEPSGGSEGIFLHLTQGVERLVKASLVSCLVAQEESELLLVNAVGGEAIVLEADSALGEPVGLGHLFYKEVFGASGGLVLRE